MKILKSRNIEIFEIRNLKIGADLCIFSYNSVSVATYVCRLVPRPHPSAKEKGLVKNDNIPGPEAGIWEFQSDRSICN